MPPSRAAAASWSLGWRGYGHSKRGERIDQGGVLVEADGATLQGAVDDEGTWSFDLTTSGATFAGNLSGLGTLALQGGGTLVMRGGDGFGGTVILGGGTFDLTSATAVGSGPIDFGQGVAGVATLQIDGTVMPRNTISGFGLGDIIDLAGVSFDSNGSATAGGYLQISASGTSYDLQLEPLVDYPAGPSACSATTSPGLDIVEGQAPITSSSTIPSGQTLSGTQVLSGGSFSVLSGGTASGLAIDSGGTWNIVSSGGTDIGTIDQRRRLSVRSVGRFRQRHGDERSGNTGRRFRRLVVQRDR